MLVWHWFFVVPNAYSSENGVHSVFGGVRADGECRETFVCLHDVESSALLRVTVVIVLAVLRLSALGACEVHIVLFGVLVFGLGVGDAAVFIQVVWQGVEDPNKRK